jgi:hypothetical protein
LAATMLALYGAMKNQKEAVSYHGPARGTSQILYSTITKLFMTQYIVIIR